MKSKLVSSDISLTDYLLANILSKMLDGKKSWKDIIQKADKDLLAYRNEILKQKEIEHNNEVRSLSEEEKAAANLLGWQVQELYLKYPCECFHPKYYRVAKRSPEDMEGLKKLIQKHGYEVVSDAISLVIREDNYTPNLSKFIQTFDTYGKVKPETKIQNAPESVNWPIR